MRVLVTIIVLGLMHCVTSNAQTRLDACEAKISSTLGRALLERFPGYRLPRVTDNLRDDVRFDLANGGDGCISVASADFDGDGTKDFAIGLTPKQGVVPIVVVALSRNDTWVFSTLKSWVDQRIRLYVAAVSPGIYKRPESTDTPLERDDRNSTRCTNSAVKVGATESTGIVYCYANRTWTYVWVSD